MQICSNLLKKSLMENNIFVQWGLGLNVTKKDCKAGFTSAYLLLFPPDIAARMYYVELSKLSTKLLTKTIIFYFTRKTTVFYFTNNSFYLGTEAATESVL